MARRGRCGVQRRPHGVQGAAEGEAEHRRIYGRRGQGSGGQLRKTGLDRRTLLQLLSCLQGSQSARCRERQTGRTACRGKGLDAWIKLFLVFFFVEKKYVCAVLLPAVSLTYSLVLYE